MSAMITPVHDAPNWLFSAFSFTAFVLVAVPLPWHLEAWNTGTCLYMIWAALANLNNFIGSVVWNNNTINWVPVWCDISTKFMIGTSVAIPAASLCINRRLYYIASIQSVTVTKAEKRRAVMTDLAIGLGIPFLEMVLHVIVQGHRFNIFEEIGCYPATFNTPPAYALVFAWPVAIGAVSAVYCVMTIRAFARRRASFNQLLSLNNNLNSSRYFRLMALAGIELLLTIPLSSYSIYLNASAQAIQPWLGWANAHWHFERVDQYPAVLWKLDQLTVLSLELSRWFVVFCALLFFAFFGFADEARKHYKLAINSVAKRVGYSTIITGVTESTGNSKSAPNMSNLPVFISKQTTAKRDSYQSFSDKLTNFTLSIADYGAFDDVKETPYSPTESSGSSSSKSSLPPSPYDEYASHELPALPIAKPEPVLDPSNIRRHSADAPSREPSIHFDSPDDV